MQYTEKHGIGRRARICATSTHYQECMYVSASRQRLDHSYESPLDADDTVKILLATDNHIGYLERDPVRGQDSINTFREVLQLAVKHDVRAVVKTSLCVALELSDLTAFSLMSHSGRFCATWWRPLPRQQTVSRLSIPSHGPSS